MKVTRPQTITYFGARVEMFEVREGGPIGPRWVYCRWIDQADQRNGGYAAGTHVVRHIDGDGRTPQFRELEPPKIITSEEYEAAKSR